MSTNNIKAGDLVRVEYPIPRPAVLVPCIRRPRPGNVCDPFKMLKQWQAARR